MPWLCINMLDFVSFDDKTTLVKKENFNANVEAVIVPQALFTYLITKYPRGAKTLQTIELIKRIQLVTDFSPSMTSHIYNFFWIAILKSIFEDLTSLRSIVDVLLF